MVAAPFQNPFRPGAGHKPPYLAGRKAEQAEFLKLLGQSVITDNLVLTGLRGVGKTVLLDEFKPLALQQGWLWVGTDLSETASISELNLAQRLITDLSVVTSSILMGQIPGNPMGFTGKSASTEVYLNYQLLMNVFENAAGLTIDKLKAVFALVAPAVKNTAKKGIIFAYDEAQNLADHAAKDQYPLSMLLDLFQSIQRQNVPFMLALVGLPTLFPKLVEARTYSERMFRVLFLSQLSENESREAVTKPVSDAQCPVKFSTIGVSNIIQYSGGYPYFIQFICRETYDAYLQKVQEGKAPSVPITEIIRKLDTDFFAGRWAKITDRQQELLFVISHIETDTGEFTVQEVTAKSVGLISKPFSRSHVNQMLSSLISSGIVYRDRHGKYLFAVPMMADFIKRVMA